MNSNILKFCIAIALAFSFVAVGAPTTSAAASTCAFTRSGTTMTLKADCTTTSTIYVPNGFTLEGAGHTITAVDPAGGRFRGAIVRNRGISANVTHLKVTTAGLTPLCPTSSADRLVGILFDRASGSIKANYLNSITQGASSCDQGNANAIAIEVRNGFSGGAIPPTSVTIANNMVTNYQRSGITVIGSVTALIDSNNISGSGPLNYIVQTGIQLSFGASGRVQNNLVSNTAYTPAYTPSAYASPGILLFQASSVDVIGNVISGTDVGIYLSDAHNANVKTNTVDRSAYNGIFVSRDSSGNSISNNLLMNSTSYDAVDDSIGTGTAGTADTWAQNKCNTNRPGGLCSSR